jgi:hypothetical protein
MPVLVVIKAAQFAKIAPDALAEAMPKAIGRLEQDAKAEAPRGEYHRKRKARRLRGSIKGRVAKNGQLGIVKAGGRVAHLVILGTQAHLIVPEFRKALRFPDGTMRRYAWHPGAHANPFLERVSRRDEGVVTRMFDAAITASIRRNDARG